MTQLNVLIDTPENAALLKDWLRHIDFVKKVDNESVEWSLPGRPATEEEILQMLETSDETEGETDATTFFDHLHKKRI